MKDDTGLAPMTDEELEALRGEMEKQGEELREALADFGGNLDDY